MELSIAVDDKGHIHIMDDDYFLPEFVVRYHNINIPNTGRKRCFFINLKSQSINLNTEDRTFVGGGKIVDY